MVTAWSMGSTKVIVKDRHQADGISPMIRSIKQGRRAEVIGTKTLKMIETGDVVIVILLNYRKQII